MSEPNTCAHCGDVVALHGMVTFRDGAWWHLACLEQREAGA